MNNIKSKHMKELAEYKRQLWEKPILRNLFMELTLRCNENCIHCGSKCTSTGSEELPLSVWQDFLDKIARDFAGRLPMLSITGGEPLLRKDLFEIMGYAHSLGFRWGMTSNGTLIDGDIAHRLYECGMGTVSISIDGLRETHDSFRRTKGGYDAAMKGLNALISHGGFKHIQVTSVIHKQNIAELEELYEIMCGLDIDSWRVLNIEPIGRAKEHSELVLLPEDYRRMFEFIKDKRREGMPVLYGCTHYLGEKYEREVRDWYFLCNAGIYTASVMANGNIGTCLDIERRAETLQGNILTHDFTDVWNNGFEYFRSDLAQRNSKCSECSSREFCGGGSFHSWDYDRCEQQVCFKDILF
ncbi:MAG: radical SAM protein [Huintestinicola sp.]|uniref:radical SAM protein n=1 Tax=Huintestinicola sp. TaxID=2981661 RepID=UPI003F1217D4